MGLAESNNKQLPFYVMNAACFTTQGMFQFYAQVKDKNIYLLRPDGLVADIYADVVLPAGESTPSRQYSPDLSYQNNAVLYMTFSVQCDPMFTGEQCDISGTYV